MAPRKPRPAPQPVPPPAGRPPPRAPAAPDAEEETIVADPLAAGPLPVDADAPERRREPTAMRALIESVVRRLNLPAQEFWREELDAVWRQAVPAVVANQLRPSKWENGVLYLGVANSTRLFEIRRLHLRAIEAALRRHFGPTRLRQVRLLVDPGQG